MMCFTTATVDDDDDEDTSLRWCRSHGMVRVQKVRKGSKMTDIKHPFTPPPSSSILNFEIMTT